MNNQIASRIASLKLCAACAAILCILGFTQHKDEADDQAVRAHVQQQAKAAAQPDTWAKLDKQGRYMTAYDCIK